MFALRCLDDEADDDVFQLTTEEKSFKLFPRQAHFPFRFVSIKKSERDEDGDEGDSEEWADEDEQKHDGEQEQDGVEGGEHKEEARTGLAVEEAEGDENGQKGEGDENMSDVDCESDVEIINGTP